MEDVTILPSADPDGSARALEIPVLDDTGRTDSNNTPGTGRYGSVRLDGGPGMDAGVSDGVSNTIAEEEVPRLCGRVGTTIPERSHNKINGENKWRQVDRRSPRNPAFDCPSLEHTLCDGLEVPSVAQHSEGYKCKVQLRGHQSDQRA